VVANEKQDGLEHTPAPQAYSAIRQRMQNPLTFVVRSALDEASVAALARREVQAVDRDLALTAVAPLRTVVSESMGDHRFRTVLVGAFAGVALLLAALGIYGVLSFIVASQQREIGVRLALGATPRRVLGAFISQGLRMAIVGLVIGLAGAWAALRLAAEAVADLGHANGLVVGATAAFVLLIATAAAFTPARRAASVDPIVTLRND